jgi:2-amino-4-hydroxy-6-hydroxymethyldihydropteridine diphosphokinase
MPEVTRAGIALGSNLGERLQHLRAALERVLQVAHVHEPVLASRVYETDPIGTGPDAGAFLNAVVEIGWSREPLELLHTLQRIEADLGRPSRRERNASRTIDLDVLYFGEHQLSLPEMTLPHPRLHLRRFVLQPLADIRPELILPDQAKPVAELLRSLVDDSRVEPISATLLPAPLPSSSIP